ncbi:DNA topoisomerase [Empedobacter sedimenti]|uniref:DNA topoisomerase n=1 Tax=Empedobacter sedimenti TaxID=3042610 RepID=UPI0024A63885|nr:DNA topoisomerase [Empedobacter sedimenti]
MKKELKNQTIEKDEINSENSVKVEKEVFISALTLICQRYFEQVNFKEKTIYQLELFHTKSFIEFKSQLIIEDEKQIKPILKTIQRIGKTEVVDIKIGNCIEEPPLLFNRIDLQSEVYSVYNLSFEETSRITEKLFENL